MNTRTALSLTLLSLLLAACGNKGPLVQAPVEATVEAGASAAEPSSGEVDEADEASSPKVEPSDREADEDGSGTLAG